MTPAVLERARLLVEPALREAVDSLDANLRLPITYHLGWTDREGAPSDAGSGKGVRSALTVLGAEAVGAPGQAAVVGAVAIELIHNFSLIHDDIMDNDRTRRHRATVWDVYGVGDAILVGDAMHALAFEVMLGRQAGVHGPAATRRLAQATSAMIAGQAQDVALDRAESATLAQCVAMEANKTGALLAQAVAIGAVLGDGPDDVVTALEHFGVSLGVGFQAVDDVLGIWGDPDRTGKPAGNDLREQKKSMPIALAFETGGHIRDAVISAFAEPMSEAQIGALARQLESAGIRDRVHSVARDHLDEAIATLDTVSLPAVVRDELVELADFVWSRSS